VGVLPDGWFLDTCGEPVRLQDFADGYVVLDASATDCGPCQQMALDEPAFETAMAAEGISVTSITLLAPTLAAILDDTPVETLEAWRNDYAVSGPVLADRGWAYAIPEHFLGVSTYPTWVVVTPDLRTVAIGNGYESFDEIADSIRTDAK
jgi:thiol-disulfide isomerase/thioredoxin